MSDITTRDIRATAAKWRERRDGDWTAQDEAELAAWFAQSPAHKIAYLRVDHVWSRADRLTALRAPAAEQRSVVSKSGMRVAAAIAVAVIVGGGAWFVFAPSPIKEQVYATSIGGRETLKLADGSQVELNTDTAIRVQLTANARRVTLEKGEVYFHVTHNAKRPFIVTAGDHRVIDLGTTFFVRRDPGRFEVALIEGRARLESANSRTAAPSRDLVPGDVVVATANTVSSQIIPAQKLANELGWRRGVLVFHGSALADVAEELNRYNTRKIVIADPEVARLTIGATIPTHGVEAFTRVARDVFGLSVTNHGSEIVISR